MALRRSARLDLRDALTMRQSEQYRMSHHAFAMKPSPVKSSSAREFGQSVDKAVLVEPVGELTLKGIRRPMMTYNVLESELMSAFGT
jgi:hypothetical protein